MINGIYVSDLSDIYAEVKAQYSNSKHLLKDLTHHTIKSFIQPFMDLYYIMQIKNSISLDNLAEFVNSFFEEFKTKRELNVEEHLRSKQENKDDQFEYDSEMKEREDFLYLKFYFFENCLKVLYSEDIKLQKTQVFFPTAENLQKLTNITLNFINSVITNFSLHAILMNVKLFNFFLKRLVIISFNYHNFKKEIRQFLANNKQISNGDEKKKNLVNFLFTYKILSINVDHCLNIEIISEQIDKFVNLLLKSKSYVKSILNTASDNVINQTHNNLLFIFNKFIKILKDEKYQKLYDELIEKFLNALDDNKNVNEQEYENFIFIFTHVVNEILSQPKRNIQEKVLKLLVRILESNHPPLHKLSIEILKKIKSENFIEYKFFINFYSVFDVLDGYNSHLFKSLWKELESLIIQCEESKDDIEFRNLLFFNNNSYENSLSSIFSIKFNYFVIIANKIKNHDNTRIQKFFIKSFSNLVKGSQIKNKNFEYFIYSTLLKMLNNPLFYPENESISYHAKIGLTAESFFFNWLEMAANRNEFENNFSQYLNGIETNITFKRIFVYLFNALWMILNKYKQTSKKLLLDMKILKTLNSIIDNNSRYLPIYQKQKFWITISNIFTRSDLKEITSELKKSSFINFVEFIKLFNSFLTNLIPIKRDCLANEFGFYNKLQSCEDLNELIEFFNKLFTTILDIDNVLCEDTFCNTIKSFESQLEDLLGSCNLNLDTILNLFWFIELVRKDEKKFFLNFMKNLNKITSPYVTDDYKTFVLANLNILFNQSNYLLKIGLDVTLPYMNNAIVIESINTNLEFLTQIFTDFIHFTFKKKNNQNFSISKDKLFYIENFNLIEDTIGKYITANLSNYKNCNLLVNSIFKFQNGISECLRTIEPAVYKAMHQVNSQFLDHSSVKMINYVLSYIRFIQMKIVMIIHLKKNIFYEFIKIKDFTDDFVNSIQIIVSFVNEVEGLLEKEKRIWMKENETKNYFNNSTMDVIKIKTMILLYLKYISHENTFNTINQILSNKNIKDIDNYYERLLEFLEKSNENEVYYVMKILSIFINFNPALISESFLKTYIQIGFKTISEKRENLNFLTTFTFLQSFINPKVVKELKFSVLDLISKTFSVVSDLNQKRSWLLLKVSTDLILNVFNDCPETICELDKIILNLAESKETRGEDSYMIDTSPEYLYMPFNIKPIDIQKTNFASEDVSRYGLYSRIKLMEYFDRKVSKINSGTYLHLIEIILEVIDKNSSMKSEMLFTEKHRKKLRLSQLLLILSKVFGNLNSNVNKEQIERIEVLTKSIFQKVNLSSVRYYLELFCINFAMIKPSLTKYFMDILSNPNSKNHCVTSSLIIIAIILLEKNYPFDTQIYNVILSLCTSNICNIRGLAQYFVYKFRDLNTLQTNKDENLLPQCFYEYLINNTQIIKFFKRFDESYLKYLNLIHNFDAVTLLKNNFDELNCEIIPIDLLREFKELAIEMVPIENTDSSKANYSWRLEIEDIEEFDESIKISSDFQKKYRPEEIETNSELACSINAKKRRRLDVIVMASLIDKAPNLGGLARTCEVFNIGSMTISSESYLNDNGFLTAAASAERWLPMVSLPVCDIEKYIKTYRKLGYTIIGLEQTANSVSLKEFDFKEKCVIVLGNEKEGIPQNLIHLLDICVIIPQFGEIRSLNVHVSAALMLWEFVNQCIKNK